MRKLEVEKVAAMLMPLAQQGVVNVEELIRQGMKHFTGWDVDSLLRPKGTPQMPEGGAQSLQQFEQNQGYAEQAKPSEDLAAAAVGQMISGLGGGA